MSIPRILLCFWLVTISVVIRADDQQRCVAYVSVVDKQGHPVQGLSVGDFHASVRNAPIRILSASAQAEPVRAVIVVDQSGSMVFDEFRREDVGKRSVVDDIVQQIITNVPTGGEIALLTFRGRRTVAVPFARTPELLRNAVIVPDLVKKGDKGGTPLWDNIFEAYKMLQPARPGDLVFAITDGTDNISRIPILRVRNDLVQAGVRLFFFLVTDFEPRTLGIDVTGDLTDVAHTTGGLALDSRQIGRQLMPLRPDRSNIGDPLDLSPAEFTWLASHPYRLELGFAEGAEQKLKVEVKDAKGKKQRAFSTRAICAPN